MIVVATIVAALGAALVFLYVRGADQRAEDQFKAVKVLVVTKEIAAGETVEAAQQAGKFELGSVGQGQLLTGALSSLDAIANQRAQSVIYPGEQVIAAKFGTGAATGGSTLTIPKGNLAISVNLTDSARVAGFVNPGDQVAIFVTNGAGSRVLLPKVAVIAVGTTTVVPTTTTDATGAQTTEQLPRTLFTLAVNQAQAEKVLYAAGGGAAGGELAFGLLNKDSKVQPGGAGANAQNLFSQ